MTGAATPPKDPEAGAPPPAAKPESGYREVIQAFGEVAAAMGELKDLDDLLHLIARHICALAGVRRCSLYLRDGESDLFRGQVGHWESDIDADIKRLVSGVDADRFTQEIVTTRAPVVVADTQSDPRPIKATMREWRVRSMLGVPMVLRDEVIGIVYLDDAERPRSYTQEDASMALAFADLAAVAISQAKFATDLQQRLAMVTRQNQLLRRAEAVEDRLSGLVLKGGSVADIIAVVAELTGQSVTLHDHALRQIAAAAPPEREQPPSGPRVLDPEVREHPTVAAMLAELELMRPSVIGPVLSAGLNQRALVVGVRVLGERWGTMVIREDGGRMTKADAVIARRAATILALEATAERRALAVRWDEHSALANVLVTSGRDPEDVERRAEHLGVRLDARHVVAIVAQRPETGDVLPSPRAIVDALQQDGRQILAASVPEGVTVLVELDDAADDGEERVAELFRERLQLADRGDRVVAISDPCMRVAGFQRGFDEARQVLACLIRFGAGNVSVLTTKALGPLRTFLATADEADVDRFVDDVLGGLLGPDDAQLLLTLDRFLRDGRSMRRAATGLDVHENTIRYRMARIEELTGMALATDSEAQLSAHMAILILRLRANNFDAKWAVGAAR